MFLEISQIHRKTPEAEVCNFIKKETLAQVISCEFCEVSKNTFSYRTPPLAASKLKMLLRLFGVSENSQNSLFFNSAISHYWNIA